MSIRALRMIHMAILICPLVSAPEQSEAQQLSLLGASLGMTLDEAEMAIREALPGASFAPFTGTQSIGIMSPCRAQANRFRALQDLAVSSGQPFQGTPLSEECRVAVLREDLGNPTRAWNIDYQGVAFGVGLSTLEGVGAGGEARIVGIFARSNTTGVEMVISFVPEDLYAATIGENDRVFAQGMFSADRFAAWGDGRCTAPWGPREIYPMASVFVDCGSYLRIAGGEGNGFRAVLVDSYSLSTGGEGDTAAPLASGLLLNSAFVEASLLSRYVAEIDRTEDINQAGADGGTALHLAVTLGTAEQVSALLEAGADIAARDAQGNTPLHLAAESLRGAAILPLLLAAGADGGTTNAAGLTPYEVAVASNRYDAQEILFAEPPSAAAAEAATAAEPAPAMTADPAPAMTADPAPAMGTESGRSLPVATSDDHRYLYSAMEAVRGIPIDAHLPREGEALLTSGLGVTLTASALQEGHRVCEAVSVPRRIALDSSSPIFYHNVGEYIASSPSVLDGISGMLRGCRAQSMVIDLRLLGNSFGSVRAVYSNTPGQWVRYENLEVRQLTDLPEASIFDPLIDFAIAHPSSPPDAAIVEYLQRNQLAHPDIAFAYFSALSNPSRPIDRARYDTRHVIPRGARGVLFLAAVMGSQRAAEILVNQYSDRRTIQSLGPLSSDGVLAAFRMNLMAKLLISGYERGVRWETTGEWPWERVSVDDPWYETMINLVSNTGLVTNEDHLLFSLNLTAGSVPPPSDRVVLSLFRRSFTRDCSNFELVLRDFRRYEDVSGSISRLAPEPQALAMTLFTRNAEVIQRGASCLLRLPATSYHLAIESAENMHCRALSESRYSCEFDAVLACPIPISGVAFYDSIVSQHCRELSAFWRLDATAEFERTTEWTIASWTAEF